MNQDYRGTAIQLLTALYTLLNGNKVALTINTDI